MFTSGMAARMGAEIEAEVMMATVPDPWMRRTMVAMTNGIRMVGRGRPATAWPMVTICTKAGVPSCMRVPPELGEASSGRPSPADI